MARLPADSVSTVQASSLTLRAMCGRLRVVKDFELDAALVVAAMCSAFEYGSQGRWP
jgi:hypothetical protein